MTPVISVCIANYNGIGLIDDCIESIHAQDANLPVEIIVHDDASTDGSAAHIRTHYPNVILLESEANVGFCIANNRMATVAQGVYLLLLNNDAALLPDALRTLHNEATRIARPAILGLPQFDFDSGKIIDRGCLLDPFFNPVPNLNVEQQDVAMTIGACLWVTRNLWGKLGGFPEWFGSIGEDLYLCCRARLAGYPVRACAESGYRHHVGTSFGGGKAKADRLSTTYRRRALSERNKTFAMFACHPRPLFALLVPLHLVLIYLEGALLTMIKWNGMLWREIYAPILPSMWRERDNLRQARSTTQAQRNSSLASWLALFRWLPWKLHMLIRHGLPEVK
jgi:GT2 family glycosyltransferase